MNCRGRRLLHEVYAHARLLQIVIGLIGAPCLGDSWETIGASYLGLKEHIHEGLRA